MAPNKVSGRVVNTFILARLKVCNSINLEFNFRAFARAYPVALAGFGRLDVIDCVQIIIEALGILCYRKHPLLFFALFNDGAATLALAVDDLFVCQNDFVFGAPVNKRFCFVCEPVFEQLQKYPLRPFIVGGVGGVYFARPVKQNAERFYLAAKVVGVLLG